MSDEYLLKSPFIGEGFKETINQIRFFEIRNARDDLLKYLKFEESVFQLHQSYHQLEKYILSEALDYLIFPYSDYDVFQDARVSANIKVQSFLNSITSLRDQSPKIAGSSPESLKQQFQRLWDAEKEKSTCFAFAERFRNYAQHQTQPVHSVSTGGGWTSDMKLCEHSTSIYADVEDVCRHREIKADEKERYYSSFGKKADIALVARQTMSSIGKILKSIRTDFKTQIDIRLKIIDNVINTHGGKPVDAICVRGSNVVISVSLFPDFTARIKKLMSNRLLTNYESHFVSSRYRGHANMPKTKLAVSE